MILINMEKIKMSVANKTLFATDRLNVITGEKIGILGANGSGKSTLLKIIAGEIKPDEGSVYCHENMIYLPQLNEKEYLCKSGGEQNRERLYSAFKKAPLLLLLDEPDNHLDMSGIGYLSSQLERFPGALLLVTHDRSLLAKVCDKYWEIDDSQIKIFAVNLEDFFAQKQNDKLTQEMAYEKYSKERKRLKQIVTKTKEKSSQVKKAPSRMGNSEARLHKMGDQKAKANIDKASNRTKTRLEKLEKVTRPKDEKVLKFDLAKGLQVYQPLLLTARGFDKRFGEKVIFSSADFSLQNGSKTALLGDNGAGKSTLLEMIKEYDSQITFVKNVKIGYLGQFFSQLDFEESIIENVRRVSVYDDTFNRTILARLLFRADSVYKKVDVLSGGERTRVSLAMLLLANVNLLLLDEPTNHLDIVSIQAVESTLKAYQGTILFASHDRSFIENVATVIWQIEDKKIKQLILN